MILNLFIVAIVLAMTYLWMSRGFFSALLNTLAVLIGGAVAFAFWEPLAGILLGVAPTKGFFGFVGSASWSIALLLPFAITTAVARVAIDKAVPGNARLNGVVSMAGGAVFGLGTGLIVAGVVVIGMGFARLPRALMGFESVQVNKGNLNREKSLWVPADDLVAKLYGHLSTTAFASSQPLAYWYPNLTTTPAAMRLTHGDGKAMNVLTEDAFRVSGRYSVAQDAGMSMGELVAADLWYPNQSQTVTDLDGNPYPSGSHLEGFIIDFDSKATEKGGQVVITNAQVRLLCENQGDTLDVYPIALVSLSDAANQTYARFRFNSRDAIASQGGGAVQMAFEFVVPAGYTPKALMVKNIRQSVDTLEISNPFSTPGERDASISSGNLMGGRNILDDLIRTEAEIVNNDPSSVGNDRVFGIYVMSQIPGRLVLTKGTEKPLELDGNDIADGRGQFDPESFRNAAGLDANLRVSKFATPVGRSLVHIDVSAGMPQSLLAPAAASVSNNTDQIRLIDSGGIVYPALGYVYIDDEIVRIRFTPDSPVRGLKQLAREGIELSQNNPAQQLFLLFSPTDGVTITTLAIGNIVLAEYTPGFIAKAIGKRK